MITMFNTDIITHNDVILITIIHLIHQNIISIHVTDSYKMETKSDINIWIDDDIKRFKIKGQSVHIKFIIGELNITSLSSAMNYFFQNIK